MRSRDYPRDPFVNLTADGLALPRTSLDQAVVTVAARLARRTAKTISYGILTQAMRLTMRRYNDAVADRLAAGYITHNPRGVCDAVERQRAMRKRYDFLAGERLWVSGWKV